ncbi:hypothetical protein CPB85DRAFT_1260939 [Mucidula mucida]|nr:hypothetical protein CPB85DRAFT_1260939 [Mucidula mucida]
MPTNNPIVVVVPGTCLAPSTINQTSEKLTDKHFNTYLKQCTSWLAAIHPKADPKKVVPLLAPRLLHQTLETYYNARAKQLDGKTVEEYVDALKARSHGPKHYKHIHENLKKAKQGNLHVNNWYEYVIVAADKLASSKKYALTDRDRIATIRDGLSVRMKNKLLERKDVEDYGDSIADGLNTDAEKWTKYHDKLQEIQELINAQEENKTNDGRSRFSVASTRKNFGGMPNPVWSGASLPSYVAPQPGSVHYPAVAAITADAGVRTLEEWFTIRYIEPAPDGEHTLKWCFDWAAANPNGFENAALAPGFQPRRPTSVSAEDIANVISYNMLERQLKPHLVPKFYRRYKPDLLINTPAPKHGPLDPVALQFLSRGIIMDMPRAPTPSRSPRPLSQTLEVISRPQPLPQTPTAIVNPYPSLLEILESPLLQQTAWQPQGTSTTNVASVGGRGRQSFSHSAAAVMGEYPNNDYDSTKKFPSFMGKDFALDLLYVRERDLPPNA